MSLLVRVLKVFATVLVAVVALVVVAAAAVFA
jgi:hypothetical protein